MKLKIFVSAYACEPDLGSEIGVGWNWVLEMSKYFDLWVLTRRSNQKSIEHWMADHPEYSHIRFLYYDLPRWSRFWKKGLRGVRLYYNLWQFGIDKIVKRTMKDNDIQIFHHLTYGNFLWSVSRYGQKQLFVWGPGSAGSVVPKEFSRRYSPKSRIKEIVQRLIRKSLRYNNIFNTQCKNSNLILCKTSDTLSSIPDKYVAKAVLFTDVAAKTENTPIVCKMKDTPPVSTLKYLAVGTLDGWRGFDVLIEAFSLALKTYPDMELEIAGTGSEWQILQASIDRLKMNSRIRLLGKISMDTYYKKMANADVIVNSCLREGGVTTAFDAMSFGKPLLCIETGGYTRHFNDDYAIIIPLKNRQDMIIGMAEGILQLTNKDMRKKKGIKAKEAAEQHTWAQIGEQIHETIRAAYSEWMKNKAKI
ncbi:MAG: glycosyltransferase family 4 protein [Tannerella sp.]|jgi:glycosyltransferase involved in cell wall biosynthesis|nr:glycosyltransferase family 4 protein [Tannerella sp.]